MIREGTNMKKTFVTLALALLFVISTSLPAFAGLKGANAITYSAGCASVYTKIAVNVHDSLRYHEGWIYYEVTNGGGCEYQVYVDYLHLFKNGNVVQQDNLDRWDEIGTFGNNRTYSTDWATACAASTIWYSDARFKFRWTTNGIDWTVGDWHYMSSDNAYACLA